jgi:TM2 domain-containing membrane protein YozV
MWPAVEDRRYKIGGFCAALAGVAPLAWLIEQVERAWPPPAEQQLLWLLTAVIGMNLMTAGLLVMAAGFGLARPAVDARRRRAIVLQLLLANLLLPLLFLGFWFDDPRGGGRAEVDIVQVALAIAGYALALAAWRLWRHSQRHAAPSAAEAMAADPRPPVLYLRSFGDDGAVWHDAERGRLARWWSELLAVATPEQETAAALDAVGPVVAIGKPGEPLPELGAARLYVDHEAWQTEVLALMDRAALVVLRIGSSPGVLWELEQALSRLPRERVVFAVIGDAPMAGEVAARLAPELGPAWQEALPAPPARPALLRRLLRWRPSARRIGALVCFPQGVARVIAVRRAGERLPGPAQWRRMLESGGRTARPLRTAWQEVIASVGLGTRRAPGRSRAVAVVLALLIGLLGAHWFYLGRHRRGAAYVVLAPLLALSMFLGWYDAVRFIWVDRAQFERRFARTAPDRP